MAFPVNSNNLRILRAYSRFSIRVQFHLPVMSQKIKQYLSNYCLFVCNCSRGLYSIFSTFSPSKSFCNHPPILRKSAPSPHPPIIPTLGFFDFTGNNIFKTRQNSF